MPEAVKNFIETNDSNSVREIQNEICLRQRYFQTCSYRTSDANQSGPIEVKAEENLQAKSLKTTLANNPTLVGLRFSMSDYREQDRLTNVPLYGINAYLETKKDI